MATGAPKQTNQSLKQAKFISSTLGCTRATTADSIYDRLARNFFPNNLQSCTLLKPQF